MFSKSVSVAKITKNFRNAESNENVIAVNDVSFSIAPGEMVALLGPSGCGKTTLLRMLSGFEHPTTGKIYIDNEDITDLPANKRDTAMVFQSYGLFPHMNVFDNVAYGLKLRKYSKSEIEDKVIKFLNMVGLQSLKQRFPSQLSGGQQQRTALVRALIVEPSVLLLDEPLSNMDAVLREQMRVEIRQLQKKLSITTIYVTHDRIEAMSIADRIIIMNHGEIVQIGTPGEIYRDPVNTFVARFVGKATFFSCIVSDVSSTHCQVRLRNQLFDIPRWDRDLKINDNALVMCRPESLLLGAPQSGISDGVITSNIYLGNSMECWVKTEEQEIPVQIDNPDVNKVWEEGEQVSLTFIPALTKVFKNNETVA